MATERERLNDDAWRQWGSFVSDREWGTVREDYSPGGDHWRYLTHDMARSYAYRWGEDGMAGFCDDKQQLCLALTLWNGRDAILKERFFGLSNAEGNHGEDVKELFFYLDATPTHSYQKMLYKYPQRAFPYEWLVAENARRGLDEGEFELLDTGLFDDDRYFDVFVEYAKAGPDDILMRITAHNRGPQPAPLHLLPTLWFRNTWAWTVDTDTDRPALTAQPDGSVRVDHPGLGQYMVETDGQCTWLFCDNETNRRRLYGSDHGPAYPKDGINDHLLHGADTVNPDRRGTKAAAHYDLTVGANDSATVRLRLRRNADGPPFDDFGRLMRQREREADAFYTSIHPEKSTDEEQVVQRQAFAGMIWNKQYYHYNVWQWLHGDPGWPAPPPQRQQGRNHTWQHLINEAVIAMPDKWEYPWYAAWDLGFHCVTFALIDPSFAKQQLLLLTNEWYLNPDGQLPSYEGSFKAVNPPVHAWVACHIFRLEEQREPGSGDRVFLRTMFEKLEINFTWWLNQKDQAGRNIFGGGFLGLDNIGVFDRNTTLPDGQRLEEADATSWMAMYALNMMRMALELGKHEPGYTDLAVKFFDHFLFIRRAIDSMGEHQQGLWDQADKFFYGQIQTSDGKVKKLKVRTLVGLFPLYAVETIDESLLGNGFSDRIHWFGDHRPDLTDQINHYLDPTDPPNESRRLLSLVDDGQFRDLLVRMLDEGEFLGSHGIRSVSRVYRDHPYEFTLAGKTFELTYAPAESDTRMSGGNSNWRGPIWMPVNYLLIDRLAEYQRYYGDTFEMECPVGSGRKLTLAEIARELTNRLIGLFVPDAGGKRPGAGTHPKWQDKHFRDYILFYEYFDGDTGRGVGANHQTGWTGLIADLIRRKYDA